MNHLGKTRILERIFLGLYAILFRFYPGGYQREFRDELHRVYRLEIEGAAQLSISALISCGLRELRDMPAAILRQHLRERNHHKMQTKGKIPTDIPSSLPAKGYPPPSNLDLLLAVLPHLLILLPSAINQLIIAWVPALAENDGSLISTILAVIVGVMIVVGWVVAWRKQWPLWSASWYGYWAWLILVVVSLINMKLNLIISWQFNNLLILGMIGLLALSYLWQARKDALRGLLSVLFLTPVITLSFLEFIPPVGESLIYLGTALVVSLSVIGIMRLRDTVRGTLLVLCANMLVGLEIAFISVYFPEYPPGVLHFPSLGEFIIQFSFFFLLVLVLITGPLAFWRVWDLVKQRLV